MLQFIIIISSIMNFAEQRELMVGDSIDTSVFGQMFMVNSAKSITITSFDFQFNGGWPLSQPFKVYYKQGDFADYSTYTDESVWTLACEGSVIPSPSSSANTGDCPISIQSGTYYSVYITDTNNNDGSNGLTTHTSSATSFYDVAASDAILTAYIGLGLSGTFVAGYGGNNYIHPYVIIHYSFQIGSLSVCPPLNTDEPNGGRCGPLFGSVRCNRGLRSYAVYCNQDNGWCGTTSTHRDLQSTDIYDWNPIQCTHDADIVIESCGVSDATDWTLARAISSSRGVWFRHQDHLQGTDGTQLTTVSEFNIGLFDDYVPGFNQFLFLTGDCSLWLIAGKDEVNGAYYSNSLRDICASSEQSTPYQARWYNRSPNKEDPWVSTIDHSSAVGAGKIVYGEYNFGGSHAANVVAPKHGVYVYIRNAESLGANGCISTTTTTQTPTQTANPEQRELVVGDSSNTGFLGEMFAVEASGGQDITLHSFDFMINVGGQTFPFYVYYKAGDFDRFNYYDEDLWTEACSGSAMAPLMGGTTNSGECTISIPSGETYSVYIAVMGIGGLVAEYLVGQSLGTEIASDDYLRAFTGYGVSTELFDETSETMIIHPYTTIHYSLGGVASKPVDEIEDVAGMFSDGTTIYIDQNMMIFGGILLILSVAITCYNMYRCYYEKYRKEYERGSLFSDTDPENVVQ